MEKITQAKLNKILKDHELWLKDGNREKRAQLKYLDFTDADLTNANLRGVDLTGANLTDANLRDADLTNANLRDADLTDADLTDADLTNAYLRDADLTNANLRDADLTNANLRDADLTDANFTGANLTHANLRGANLTGANLDFSMWGLSCKTLNARIGNRLIIQLLYHASMPTQNNKLELDEDIVKLFNSKLFKQVVNKFHRVYECGTFIGTKK